MPLIEPISVAAAKLQCEVEAGETRWDGLIADYVTSARGMVETRTGHILVQRAMTESFAAFPFHDRPLQLWKTPISSVDELRYFDFYEVEQTYSNPIVRLEPVPTRIYPAAGVRCWPLGSCRGGVTVEFTAGYAAGEEPPELIQAMRLLIAHWFVNREEGAAILNSIPMGVDALCNGLRLPMVG